MVKVIRPTVGPVKAVTQADIDAAKAPVPANPCVIQEYTYLSTTPYPVYSIDSISEIQSILDLNLIVYEPVAVQQSLAMTTVTTAIVISYSDFNQGPESLQQELGMISIEKEYINNPHSYYDQGPADITQSFEILSITREVVIGYIFITQPPDNISEDMNVLGVTLTPV